MIWAGANTAVKISILDLYIQIFRNRSFRIVSYVLMAVSIGYFIMVILEAFLLCKPFAYSWDKLREGHCGNEHDVYLSSGIMNLFIDVIIVVLPMPMLWGLQLGLAKKLALTFIFGVGALWVKFRSAECVANWRCTGSVSFRSSAWLTSRGLI